MNKIENGKSGNGRPRHPIRVVAQRTGLTPDVLRAWEKRYGVVEPGRSDAGQRLYSDEDVDRLRLLRQVTEAGRPIGRVAGLGSAELRRLAEEDEAARRHADRGRVTAVEVASAAVVEAAMVGVRELNGVRLERELFRGALHLGRGVFLEQVAAPLLKRVGDAWHAGELGVAQEHLATATLHRVVDWLLGPGSPSDGPVVVVATPPGQRHEMGALLSAAVAVDEGWRVVYLGADVPGEEIARAAVESGAGLVALSLVYPEGDAAAAAALRALRASAPTNLAIVVGGSAAASHESVLREVHATRLDDLESLRAYLRSRQPARAG